MKKARGKTAFHIGSGCYTCRMYGKPKYAPKTCTTLEEAELYFAGLLVAMKKEQGHTDIIDTTTDIKDLCNLYLSKVVPPSPRGHHHNKRKWINEFVRFFEGRSVSSLRPWEVEAWVKSHDTWSDSTKNGCCRNLAACFNWLLTNRYITASPLKGVKRPKAQSRGKEVIIDALEYARMVAVCPARWKDVLTLAWETGARPSELTDCLVEWYDPTEHCLRLPLGEAKVKTKVREILLTDVAEVVVLRNIAGRTNGYILETTLGKKLSAARWNEIVVDIARKAGVTKHAVAYSFRHSFAVRHLLRGVPINIVAGWLGDTVEIVAKHYGHIAESVTQTRGHLVSDAPKMGQAG